MGKIPFENACNTWKKCHHCRAFEMGKAFVELNKQPISKSIVNRKSLHVP